MSNSERVLSNFPCNQRPSHGFLITLDICSEPEAQFELRPYHVPRPIVFEVPKIIHRIGKTWVKLLDSHRTEDTGLNFFCVNGIDYGNATD